MVTTIIDFMTSNAYLFMVIHIFVLYSAVLLFYKLFGRIGLYLVSAVCILVANIAVMKQTYFGVFSLFGYEVGSFGAVALGTGMFTAIFLCTDIISEKYGAEDARKTVWLSAGAFIFFTVFMYFIIAYPANGQDWGHGHISELFMPMPKFLLAGMIAYISSQLFDIWIYDVLHRMTGDSLLWLRNNLSTILSSLLDNTVFSLLAWIVLADEPKPLETVIWVYILGTYIFRAVAALLDTPFIHIARRIKPIMDE